MPSDTLKAIALNCTLKRGKDPSSTDKLLGELLDGLGQHGVAGEAHLARLLKSGAYPGIS